MNLEQNLRQLHKIEPDQAYARDSRARLMLAVGRQTPKVTLRVLLTGMLRSGFAMAAIGLLFFFAVGGSVWNLVVSPVTKLAKWDSQTLLAEAQAIDTQIHLTDLQYSDPGYERQRLISPNTNFNSISIASSPEPVSPAAKPADDDTNATSTDAKPADDDTNATSTDAKPADDDTNATSTDAKPVDTAVDVKEALEILSH